MLIYYHQYNTIYKDKALNVTNANEGFLRIDAIKLN